MKTYTKRDVVRLTAATASLVTRWCDIEAIVPDGGLPGGKGKHRQFSFWNLMEFEIGAALHARGIGPGGFQMILRNLRRLDPETYASGLRDSLAGRTEAALAVLTPEARAAEIRRLNKAWGAGPVPMRAYTFADGLRDLNAELAGAGDSDAKRWALVKHPATRPSMAYLFVHSAAPDLYLGSLHTTLEILDSWLTIAAHAPQLKAGFGGAAAVIVDLRSILDSLERATGDRL
jgi:hypothetical protein